MDITRHKGEFLDIFQYYSKNLGKSDEQVDKYAKLLNQHLLIPDLSNIVISYLNVTHYCKGCQCYHRGSHCYYCKPEQILTYTLQGGANFHLKDDDRVCCHPTHDEDLNFIKGFLLSDCQVLSSGFNKECGGILVDKFSGLAATRQRVDGDNILNVLSTHKYQLELEYTIQSTLSKEDFNKDYDNDVPIVNCLGYWLTIIPNIKVQKFIYADFTIS